MNKQFLSLLLLPLACFANYSATNAVLPQYNLTTIKKELTEYHDSGLYKRDIGKVAKRALFYMRFRINQNRRLSQPKKLALVLSIDETALSNYNDMKQLDFGGRKQDIEQLKQAAHDPSMPYIQTLYQYAQDYHVAVFFMTNRREQLRKQTETNLVKDHYKHWEHLYMLPNNYQLSSVVPFRTSTRQKITQQGYDIIENIGSQDSDLSGAYADMTFKLPNPFYQVS